MKKHLYIDSNYLVASSGETFNSINPANGETIAIVEQANDKDVKGRFCHPRKLFNFGVK